MSSNSKPKMYIRNSVGSQGKTGVMKAKSINITAEYIGCSPPEPKDADIYIINAVFGLEGATTEVADDHINVIERVNVSQNSSNSMQNSSSIPIENHANSTITTGSGNSSDSSAECDMSFLVQCQKMSVNRVSLVERGAKFLSLFPQTICEHDVKNVDPVVFQLLLNFIKNGTIESVQMQQYAGKLLSVANRFKVDKLTQYLSEELFIKTLNKENAVNYLILTEDHKLLEQRENILKFIKEHPTVEKSPEFRKVLKSPDKTDLQMEWSKIRRMNSALFDFE